MPIIIDIVALAIVAISALVAYFRGFVKTFFGFISAIVALALAFLFYQPLAVHIKNTTDIDDWVYESIVAFGNGKEEKQDVQGQMDSGETESQTERMEQGEIPVLAETETSGKEDALSQRFLTKIDHLPDALSESISVSFDLEGKKELILTGIATKISNAVVNILAWLLIYVAARIILLILMLVLDGLMQLPVLKTVNNVIGMILGIIMGIFRVYLILAIIYFISNVANIGDLTEMIEGSYVVSHMYYHNLLIQLIF